MRRTWNSEVLEGDCIGINFGADFCAEHEWGIKELKMRFGIGNIQVGFKQRIINIFKNLMGKDTEHYGLINRTTTYVPHNLIYKEFSGGLTLLMFSPYYEAEKIDRNKLPFELNEIHQEHDDMICAWSDKDFGIVTKDINKRSLLKRLYQAFQEKDICVALGAKQFIQNGGFMLIVASTIPEDVKQEWYNADRDNAMLQKKAEETGIAKLLANNGKKYYALSPRWKDDNKQEVIFWLNPQDQRNNNACWCTVEDLKQWINNEGKIPIAK